MPFPVSGRIAELLRRSTVHIRSGSGRGEHSGSGVVLNNGRVLTNAHVLGRGVARIESWEGAQKEGMIAKVDRRHDLALLSAPELDAPSAELSDAVPRPGEPVIAVGNPFGFTGAVSTGVIHATGRISGLGQSDWIQADVRLAPGNSGGPLADLHGRVIGVNTMIVGGGLALAIPARRVQAFLSSRPPRELGVVLRPVQEPRLRRTTLLILEVVENSPAMRASLLPGDLIVGANGAEIHAADDLHDAMEKSATIELQFLRGGQTAERRVTVQLAAPPMTSAA